MGGPWMTMIPWAPNCVGASDYGAGKTLTVSVSVAELSPYPLSK